MAERLPPEVESKLSRLQALQAQYARIAQERTAVESEIAEVDRILNILGEVEDKYVYRAVAGILVKVEKEKIVNELNDKKELLQLRLQKLKKQEEALKKQIEELAKQIQKLRGIVGKPGGAG